MAKTFSQDWNQYYKETEVTKMPWYTTNLDFDLENEIKQRKLVQGRFLDLGTGPGTQATQIANLGFDVTGTDVSEDAIEKAKKRSSDVNFITDDVLNSKLPDKSFDFIFDRGCFHLFDHSNRKIFVNQIKRLLADDGILFLKCMSTDQPEFKDGEGPNRLTKQEIFDSFSEFETESIKSSSFEATIDPWPKAWFVVMKLKQD